MKSHQILTNQIALESLDFLLTYFSKPDREFPSPCLQAMFLAADAPAVIEKLYRAIRSKLGMNKRNAFAHAIRLAFLGTRLPEQIDNEPIVLRLESPDPLLPTNRIRLDYTPSKSHQIQASRIACADELDGCGALDRMYNDIQQQGIRVFRLPLHNYSGSQVVRDVVEYRGGRNAKLRIALTTYTTDDGAQPSSQQLESRMTGLDITTQLQLKSVDSARASDRRIVLDGTPNANFMTKVAIAENPGLFSIADRPGHQQGFRTLAVVHEQEFAALTLVPFKTTEVGGDLTINQSNRLRRLLMHRTDRADIACAMESLFEERVQLTLIETLWMIACELARIAAKNPQLLGR
ncbi:MAG: hypothetical protein QM516_12410 [Limnohabitans sp.]|nr:hypothetical protein [Limnohabitans sp.]